MQLFEMHGPYIQLSEMHDPTGRVNPIMSSVHKIDKITFKNLQQMLQDFQRVFHHWYMVKEVQSESCFHAKCGLAWSLHCHENWMC